MLHLAERDAYTRRVFYHFVSGGFHVFKSRHFGKKRGDRRPVAIGESGGWLIVSAAFGSSVL
jgi:hypothetical protein